MDNKDFEYFKNKLLKEKKEVLNAIAHEEDSGIHSSMQDYYSELSIYDNHPADIGSETFEKEMQFNLEENEKRHLRDIDDAIERIKKGTYGICNSCGKNIEIDRLEIIPYTKICAKCSNEKSALDLVEKMNTRPVEEETLNYPFGRTFKDQSKFNGFDGEDSWQAVARYNKTDYKNMALDWYDNNMYDDNISGKVENVDDISYSYYKRQVDDFKKKDREK
ncbi:TraR/DksA C4-type zinc finger protein [Paramaledivibacter caminithermalis]|uniref:Transcriptional regulator, TraR/DksA family n=1 Tax=Paramaledivibacter caminithermalis (strain DSM 15212 / CIP 107654 / DViRD3) TaxID=1121301 RepID=A0A1M6NGQ9_PARC5|nr:TraR/DksA C4-type zinc finger protein [Paramaledivibacter caminithermalis]SHJ94806.1 transcriptional regulator, TraR/DksA family [Paramaledivibacter caminithermalis DSM 15212]